MTGFSVLMAVYHNDEKKQFYTALSSVTKEQTLAPNQVVIVCDGLVPWFDDNEVKKLYSDFFIEIYKLHKNSGLGIALCYGLAKCRFEYVARMDSDDISVPSRFQRQINYLKKNENLALLGSSVREFNEKSELQIKKPPISWEEIIQYSKVRNPFNHPTVIFKKKIIEAVGSYRDMPGFEDYDLWLRVIEANYKVENLSEITVFMRTSEQFYDRRRGRRYSTSELSFCQKMYKESNFTFSNAVVFLSIRFIARLLPAFFLKKLYNVFLREK